MPITPTAYQSIIATAWNYLLDGGGIVPGDSGNLEDRISRIAADVFDAKTADTAFSKSIARFDHAEHERIWGAAW